MNLTATQFFYLILVICVVGVAALFALLWLAACVSSLLKTMRGSPPNEQIQQSHEQLVRDHKETRSRVIKLEEHHLKTSRDISDSQAVVLKAGEDRELRINQAIKEVDTKVEDMPERLLNMLTHIKDLNK